MKELPVIINKILELDPVSGVSIVFSILFFMFSKFTIKSINDSHKSTIEKIEEVYNENLKTIKGILNTYLEKEKKVERMHIMEKVIVIFMALFIFQFSIYLKIKKRIEKRTQYAYVVTNLISNYLSYLEIKEKVRKYKQIDKFINARITELDLLMGAYSFDDIFIKKIEINQKKNIKETKMLINELRNAPLEINLLFMAFFTTSKILFENTRIEITEGLKIRGKNFIVLMELKDKILNLVNNTRNVEVSNHKKEELELLHKNNFRIIS